MKGSSSNSLATTGLHLTKLTTTSAIPLQKLGHTKIDDEDDGVFWIPWEKFLEEFSMIDLWYGDLRS